jgi:hypothetical protein
MTGRQGCHPERVPAGWPGSLSISPTNKMQKDTQHLKCILTREEAEQHAKAMAKAHQELTDLEAQKKSATKQFDAKIETQKATLNRESTLVSQNYEFRNVEGFWRLDHPVKGMKTFIRADSVVAHPPEYIAETVPMTSEDTQKTLNL